MGAARNIIEHAREAGLPPDLAEQLERDLVPRLEEFLARVPTLPPGRDEETTLIVGLLELYRPHWPLLTRALGALSDGLSGALEDLQAADLQADPARSRAVALIDDATCSLVKVGTVAATLVARLDPAEMEFPENVEPSEMPEDLRTYLRGMLSLLVALDRVRGDLAALASWAWLARRDLIKSEALVLVAFREFESMPPRPRRLPGGWRGRVHAPQDVDEPLPASSESAVETERVLARLVERGELHLGRRTDHPPRPTGVALPPGVVAEYLDDLRGDR